MLTIRELSKRYGNGVQALDGVTLEIGTGLFGLLGPNGAGKSTLMRTIATLQEADSGSIHFDGIDVLRNPRALRQQLGYLPQDFGVYPRIPAQDLLDHLAILKGVRDRGDRTQQVSELLQLTNLHHVRKRPVSTFSGGMRQRFGIAQALLGSPRLMIVDEPTAGLDPEERNRFHDLLSEVGEEIVVILSTHIVEDVSDLCSNMAVLAHGRVLSEGRPRDLIARLEGRIWERTVERIEIESYRQTHNVISTRLSEGRRLLRIRAESGPSGFLPARPDLEDVYFDVLTRSSERPAA